MRCSEPGMVSWFAIMVHRGAGSARFRLPIIGAGGKEAGTFRPRPEIITKPWKTFP